LHIPPSQTPWSHDGTPAWYLPEPLTAPQDRLRAAGIAPREARRVDAAGAHSSASDAHEGLQVE